MINKFEENRKVKLIMNLLIEEINFKKYNN